MFVSLVVIIFLMFPRHEESRIYSNVFIHGVNVGGMNFEEANASLMDRFQPGLEAQSIRFIKNDEAAVEYLFTDFDARFDFSELVEVALGYNYLKDLPFRLARLFGRKIEILEPPQLVFSPDKLEDIMKNISLKFDIVPQNASFYYENGYILIKEERIGSGVNTEAATLQAKEILNSFLSNTVHLNVVEVRPMYTSGDLNFTKSTLAYYETRYHGGENDPRVKNIKIASERIHNQMLYPNQVFSAGQIIAAHLPNSGYEISIVLVNGEPVEDVGGGVCQVVSTLYNAVLRAELEIVQRHNHSARVSYVDMGFDATVAGDYYDLKFKNTTPHPLLITSSVKDGVLNITLFGYETREESRSLRFEARQVELILPDEYKEVEDDTLNPGEYYVILESQMGYRIELFKLVYVNGVQTEEIKVNTSTYKPLQGVIAIGVG